MGTSLALGSLSPQQSVLQARQDQLVRQIQSPEQLSDAKIDKGSKEFEAILLGSWLQQAEQSFTTLPGTDDDDKDVASDQVMSFGVQALSTSLAASGGIGISKMIAKAMHAAADKATSLASAQTGQTNETEVAKNR
jgi:Rod binding domain-containing protein